jgi:hypothetical protein
MVGWLLRHQERGEIKLDDPQAAAGMLRGMMLMEPQRAVLFGQQGLPTEAEIAQRAKACATLFINGCLS